MDEIFTCWSHRQHTRLSLLFARRNAALQLGSLVSTSHAALIYELHPSL